MPKMFTHKLTHEAVVTFALFFGLSAFILLVGLAVFADEWLRRRRRGETFNRSDSEPSRIASPAPSVQPRPSDAPQARPWT